MPDGWNCIANELKYHYKEYIIIMDIYQLVFINVNWHKFGQKQILTKHYKFKFTFAKYNIILICRQKNIIYILVTNYKIKFGQKTIHYSNKPDKFKPDKFIKIKYLYLLTVFFFW